MFLGLLCDWSGRSSTKNVEASTVAAQKANVIQSSFGLFSAADDALFGVEAGGRKDVHPVYVQDSGAGKPAIGGVSSRVQFGKSMKEPGRIHHKPKAYIANPCRSQARMKD